MFAFDKINIENMCNIYLGERMKKKLVLLSLLIGGNLFPQGRYQAKYKIINETNSRAIVDLKLVDSAFGDWACKDVHKVVPAKGTATGDMGWCELHKIEVKIGHHGEGKIQKIDGKHVKIFINPSGSTFNLDVKTYPTTTVNVP